MKEFNLRAFRQFVVISILCMCICVMCILTGCGNQDVDTSQATEGENVASVQWKERGMVWKVPMSIEVDGENPHTEIAYGNVTLPEPDFAYESKQEYFDYWQNNQYTLIHYRLASGNRYILVVGAGSATELETKEFTCMQELPKGYVAAMDVVGPEDMALLYVAGEEDSLQYLLLHLDSQGQLLSQTDMTEGYGGQELTVRDLAQDYWYCDEAGNSYVLAGQGQRLLIFSPESKLIFSKGFDPNMMEHMTTAFHAPDGSLLMALEDPGQHLTKLLWYEVGKKQLKELAAINSIGVRPFQLAQNDLMYYIADSNLWCWNIEDGSQQNLYSLLGGVVPNSMTEYVSHIAFTEEENLLLYIQTREGLEYCLLSNKPQEEGIRLVDLMGQFYISGRVTAFNRENPEAKISYEKEQWGDAGLSDTLWKRTQAELAAGKGPDIICLHSTDERVDVLYEKGILANLEDVLPEEVESQIFPGLIQEGTRKGELIGICPEAMAWVLVTTDETWNQDQWSQQEVLELVENNQELEGIYYFDGKMTPIANLVFLATRHIENAPWIDWEKGESHFESEDFKRVLELSKEYGEKPACKESEKQEFLRDGAYLATPEYLFSLSYFPQLMEQYGEEYRFIGFPGQEDYVGYWNSGYLVMINKKTAYWEECKQFVNYIMTEENLGHTNYSPSREDVIRNRIYQIGDVWYMPVDENRNGGYNFTKPDGSSYLEDYLAFLKNLGNLPTETYITTIVEEEAQAYFDGRADLDRTVEVIDSRVQIYLDERK